MHQAFFSIRLRRYTTMSFIFTMVFFAYLMGASASDQCPLPNSHELSAHRYKMFTAYQTAFDGYEAPCELKCFSNENCLSSCRENKALESLGSHFKSELAKRGISQCRTLSQVCVEQCGADAQSCESACKG